MLPAIIVVIVTKAQSDAHHIIKSHFDEAKSQLTNVHHSNVEC